MIVTIDGPAGAGKSSAARELARRLGFRFLDTGAMYRAVTLAANQRGIDLSDAAGLENLAHEISIVVAGQRVLLDGKDVTDEIRTFEITTTTHFAADHPGVRQRLVELQREIAADTDSADTDAANSGIVTEGRDQATVVFPNAACKIYLTASEEVRAERRFRDLQSRGEDLSYDEVLRKQQQRDDRDQNRPIGALRKTDETIEVNTDGMSPEEVVDELERIVLKRKAI